MTLTQPTKAIVLVAVSEQRPAQQAITQLPVGRKARILHIPSPEYSSKLMAMGILPGQAIRLVRKAPFGGGWYVQVGNYFFALRQAEAEAIIVEV